jgi:predicted DNA-binding protein (MmcQ/YjbR family)
MTQKLEEGTPEYDYLMIMMGDDELVVVFDNVMPQEEFSLLIKSSINQFKNSSEVLDQMRSFKKEEKGAGMNHDHYAEQKEKLTMTKSEFYQYITSSKEQIEVVVEEKPYNSKECVMVSSM